MNFSKAIELIKEFEGFKSKAYKLEGEKFFTIGFGRYGAHVGANEVTTEEAEYEWLIARLTADYNTIADTHVPLTENQVNALLSFVYNVGMHAFLTSTLLRKLKAGDDTAPREFDRWVKSSSESHKEGLIRRRKAERALFEKDSVQNSYGTFTLPNAARYTTGFLQHQNDAWNWLEKNIDRECMLEFIERYRSE